LSVDAHS
jgi:hypothetical protein